MSLSGLAAKEPGLVSGFQEQLREAGKTRGPGLSGVQKERPLL